MQKFVSHVGEVDCLDPFPFDAVGWLIPEIAGSKWWDVCRGVKLMNLGNQIGGKTEVTYKDGAAHDVRSLVAIRCQATTCISLQDSYYSNRREESELFCHKGVCCGSVTNQRLRGTSSAIDCLSRDMAPLPMQKQIILPPSCSTTRTLQVEH
jgi:hypothetical protein